MMDFKQILTENSYSRQEELVFWDCDREKRARPAALLSKMAAFAGYDYDARGLTYEKLYALREVFLLSRAAIQIHDCPHAADVLTVTTWENGAKGAHMQRVYEMRDQAGRLRVSGKSDWILVDPISRKILRPASFTAKEITTCPKEIDCPDPRKVVLPKEGRTDLGTRTVRWSDLDGNGHLFSGNYADIVWDALPAELQERTVKQFFVNYSREAVLDETLRLSGFREGDVYRVEGAGRDGICFTAECVF